MGDATKNFDYAEFSCHCCGKLCSDWKAGEVPQIILSVQKFRDLVGKPVQILSGYRCPKHNAEVEGVRFSQHLVGNAADVRVQGMSPAEMRSIAEKIPEFLHGGIGIYEASDFTHLDVRGYRARWTG